VIRRFVVRGQNGDLNVVSCGVIGSPMPHGKGSTFVHESDARSWADRLGHMEVLEVDVEDDRNACGLGSSLLRAQARRSL